MANVFAHGIGEEKSRCVYKWGKENIDKFKALSEILTISDIAKSEGKCTGYTFVITGEVHSFKNRDELKSYIEAEGGKVAGSVSGKTNYLVNNDTESTTSKNQKAKSCGVSEAIAPLACIVTTMNKLRPSVKRPPQ